MTEGDKKDRTYTWALWTAVALIMAFNTAAAASPSQIMTYTALALSGVLALAGIGFGIWTGYRVGRFGRALRS